MPRIDADRNLLFGITALQNDFITRDALIAAMNAWALEKHRPIGEILVERDALDPDDRAALEAMIARRLAKHGDDPAASLAAMSSVESIAAEIRRSVADPEAHGSLSANPDRDQYGTRFSVSAQAIPSTIRYHKVRDHAEGGLGVVYVARDQELKREVALKEIKAHHAHHPTHQARFLVEAEITGGLEHPGIVPVYGLGHYDDGRPYYAMRFIRGDSLKHAIAAFHADKSLKSDPGARTLALQKLLRRFTDVCNAVGYAHSRGILHRDLKPDNVMVGKHGETLVVDWGLAKSIGRSGDGMETMAEAVLVASSKGSAETLPGSQVGTPSYMSPEQAAGRLDLLGPASDVYGLGATLYSLLTGLPPVRGGDLNDVLRRVERGDFPRPRQSAPWLDPALEAVCLKAMALKPIDRYATPRDLANDLDRWIAGAPVTAYREPWTRRARRWASKHRTGLATTTSTLAVTAALLGIVAGIRLAESRKAETAARAYLLESDAWAIRAQTSGLLADWERAGNEAKLARERLESAGPLVLRAAVDARLASIRDERSRRAAEIEADRKDHEVVAALEEARLRGAAEKDGMYDDKARVDAYLGAFQVYGIDVATLPVAEAAGRIRHSRVAEKLIESLDDWSRFGRNVPIASLSEIARLAESDPSRLAIRDAINRKDVAALRRLCETPEARSRLGPRVRRVFDALLRLDPGPSFALLEATLAENPADFWMNQDFGVAFSEPRSGHAVEGLRHLTAAVALRPDSSGTHLNLGNALVHQGHLDAAIAEHRQAIRINPDYAGAYASLGDVLRRQGHLDAAVAECHLALRIRPDFAEAHLNLGVALSDQGQLDAAIAEYRQAIRIKPDFAQAHDNLGLALSRQGQLDAAVAEYRLAIRINPDYAGAYASLGNALRLQGHLDAAIAEYRQAIRIRLDFAEAHYNLGVVLGDQGHLDAAVAEYRRALQIEPDFAQAHNNLGLALRRQGQLEMAIAEYRQALRIKPDLPQAHMNLGLALDDQGQFQSAAAEYRQALRFQPDNAQAHSSLGNILRRQGQLDAAVAECNLALRIKPDYAEAHLNLGLALSEQGHPDAAIAEYRQAIRINPDYALAHNNLGVVLDDQGHLDAAVAEYRHAIRINLNDAQAHSNLGNTLRRQGHLDAAVDEGRQAIRINPEYELARVNLAAALSDQGHLDAAIVEYRQAIRIRPDYAKAHCNLADALSDQGDLDAAVAEYRHAIRILPDYAQAHSNLGLALVGQGQVAQGIAEHRQAIRINPDYAPAHYNLGNALRVQGQHDAAVAEYCQAIRIKPDFAEAFCNLGVAFSDLLRFAEAVENLEKGHALGSKRQGWKEPSAAWVREAKGLVELDGKLGRS